MKDIHRFILDIKNCNDKYVKINNNNLIELLIEDRNISHEFKDFLFNLLEYYINLNLHIFLKVQFYY